MNKFIHGFWVSYGFIKIKVSESSSPCIITHDVDLEIMFPGNPLLKDISKDWVSIAHKCCVCYIYVLYMCIFVYRVGYIYKYCYIYLTKQSQKFMTGLLQIHLSILVLW